MNNLYEGEITTLLRQISNTTIIINIDHIILGKLKLTDILQQTTLKSKSKKNISNIKVAALTILYQYDTSALSNIHSYAETVDQLYLFDNNEIVSNYPILKSNFPKARILLEHNNVGICAAINKVADIAFQEQYEWLITFDQDSIAASNMIRAMTTSMQKYDFISQAGILAPNVIDKRFSSFTPSILPYSYWDKVIQSGAMHNLSILKKIGGYDENLFIDQADYEYCIRLRQHGYTIIKINDALLEHNVNDSKTSMYYENGKKIFQNKYSPERCYYIIRNNLYCREKYKTINPIYALECDNNIAVLKRTIIGDDNYQIKEQYIHQAYEDFYSHKMGKLSYINKRKVE